MEAVSVRLWIRTGLTVFWIAALGIFFRWWEVTLTLPPVLLWTALFVVLFAATAGCVHGRAVLDRRHEVWKRPALWVALVLVALIGFSAFPEASIRGTPVRTVTFAGVLDVVFPGWIFLSALTLLWEGPARWGVLAAVAVILLLGVWGFVIRMPGTSFVGPLQSFTAEQQECRDALEVHVHRLSAEIGERNDGKLEALRDAEWYIDSVLVELGYEVRTHEFEVGAILFRNLEVEIPGASRPDEIVVVGAHYDTVEGTAGADDNASGSAGVLELARMFAPALATESPARTLRFVLFVNEEPPFFNTEWMGSRVYAARSAERDENIVAMISLETIGYYSTEPGSQRYPPPFSFFYPGRGDFVGFVGNLGSGGLVRQALGVFREHGGFPSQGVSSPSWIPGITWSDHASFWHHGFKAIMITDTAPFRNPFYHTSGDTIDKLDFDRMTRVVDGIAAVVRALASQA